MRGVTRGSVPGSYGAAACPHVWGVLQTRRTAAHPRDGARRGIHGWQPRREGREHIRAYARQTGDVSRLASRFLGARGSKMIHTESGDSSASPMSTFSGRFTIRTSHDAAPGTEVPDTWLAPRCRCSLRRLHRGAGAGRCTAGACTFGARCSSVQAPRT